MPNLTQRVAEQHENVRAEVWIWDDHLVGFHIRARPGARPVWGIRYKVGGKTRTKVIGPCHEVKQAAARERAREIKEASRVGRDLSSEDKSRAIEKTFTELWDDHKEDHRPPLIAESTYRNRKHYWDAYLLPKIGKLRPYELKKIHIAELKADLEDKPATFNHSRTALVKLINTYGLPNPVSAVKPYTEKRRNIVLSLEETDRVLTALRNRVASGDVRAALIYLLVTTGLRYSEWALREWSDFSHNARELTLRKTKGGKGRTVYLSTDAADVVNALPRTSRFIFTGRFERPMTHTRRYWYRLRSELEIPPNVRIHDLRHSAASWAHHRGGLSIKEVSELLGHASVSTTERYLNVHEERQRAISEVASRAIIGISKQDRET
jgi:integrase